MSLSPGDSIGHYEILAKLGEGGMGEVYEARDEKLGRIVALKVLTAESAQKQSRMDRFRTEAKAVAALNHPNIVQIYSVEEADGVRFLTMERAAGEPLDDCIPDEGMEVERFLDLATSLAAAVAAAHSAGVTHRDLKPANILVNDHGQPKILDFGLAKMEPRPETTVGDDERTVMMTREGAVLGSAPYMSPEQARGEGIDARSDLFSLGTVFYQALTGVSPFLRRSPVESQFAVIRSEPTALPELRPDLPPGLASVVERAMAKDPDHRYRTADSLLADLKELQREVQLRSTDTADSRPSASPSTLARTRSARIRRRWLWPLAAAAVLAVGWLGWNRVTAPAASATAHQSLAVLPFDNLTGSPASDYLGTGIAVHLITRLSELSDLRVVGRSEAWDEGSEAKSRQELARRLGVDMFLEGGVQRDDGNLRVSVHLTDAKRNATVWAEDFVEADDRLMDLQAEIARWVTGVLQVSVSRGERRRLTQDPTRSFKAYDFYLQGQEFLSNRQLRRGPELAEQVFRQATRLDPDFALAYVGLSEALWRRFRDGEGREFLDQADEAAQEALAIDPQLAAGQVARARILREHGEIGRSIAELKQAVASHPKPDEAYVELGLSYRRAGEHTAAEEAFRAATALGPENWSNWNLLGGTLSDQGEYEEAGEAFAKAEVLAPEGTQWGPNTNLVAVQLLQARWAEAAATFEGDPEDIGHASLAANLGTAFFFIDDLERAEVFYQRAIELDPQDPRVVGNLADVLTGRGRNSEAQATYERAVRLADAQAEATRDPTDRLMAAFYHAKAGDCEAAIESVQDASPTAAGGGHRIAKTYALCGTPQQAIDAVRRAIELGVSAKVIAAEPEFSHLVGEPTFDRLVASPAITDR